MAFLLPLNGIHNMCRRERERERAGADTHVNVAMSREEVITRPSISISRHLYCNVEASPYITRHV